MVPAIFRVVPGGLLSPEFRLTGCARSQMTDDEFARHGYRGRSVCCKPTGGQAFAQTAEELDQLLQQATKDSAAEVGRQDDTYGYRWATVGLPDLSELVTTVHLVNATLQDHGFGPQLLCSAFGLRPGDGGSGCFLVYLYKRGTFYPFAPMGGERRDTELELRLRGILAADLPTEQDLSRWFPPWGPPVL